MEERSVNLHPPKGRWHRQHIRLWIKLVQQATPILARKHPGEPPRPIGTWLQVEQLDDEHVAGLCARDGKGPAQIMDVREVDVLDVKGGIVIADLAAGPVERLDADGLVGDNGGVGGNCGTRLGSGMAG